MATVDVEPAITGDDAIGSRVGVPTPRLVRFGEEPRRRLGILEGQITIPADFDDPLPDDLIAAFEGR